MLVMVSREAKPPVIHMKAEEYHLKSWAQKCRHLIPWKYINPNNRERWRSNFQNPWKRHLCRWLKILPYQLKIFVPWPWNTITQEPILASRMSSLLLKDFCESVCRNSFHTCFEFYDNFFSLKTCLKISSISFLSLGNWLICCVADKRTSAARA